MEISLTISGSPCVFTFKTLDLKTKWKEKLLSLHMMHLEALVRKKAIRIQRSKKPLQPQEIDPEDELGLLENENQLLANQLHSIALSGGQLPSTGSAQYLPVGDKSKPLKKKPVSMLSFVKDRLGTDQDENNNSQKPRLNRNNTTPSVLDLFEKLNRTQRDYSNLAHLVVLFQGPKYAGKTTIIRKLMAICTNEHQFRCAYLHESSFFSVLDPFTTNDCVSNPQSVRHKVQSSLILGNIVQTILQLENSDLCYDIIFIDGEFRYESQVTAVLKPLENLEITTLICTTSAPESTLLARKQSLVKHKGSKQPVISPEQTPHSYRTIPVPNSMQINTVQPVSKCVTYVLMQILASLK